MRWRLLAAVVAVVFALWALLLFSVQDPRDGKKRSSCTLRAFRVPRETKIRADAITLVPPRLTKHIASAS